MRTSCSLALISLVMVLAVVGCSNSSKTAQTGRSPVIHDVATAPVQMDSASATEEILGTVTARNRAEIATKIQARVESIPVTLGSHVAKGDPLVLLDMRDLQAHEAQTLAVSEQSAQELKRYTQLVDRKLVSQEEYDRVKAQADIAQASLQEARAMLNYARVVAPFNGVVTQKMIDLGDLTTPGVPLFAVEEDANLRLVASIPESRQGQVKVGDSLKVLIPSLDTVLSGAVVELSTSADPTSRSFEVKIALPAFPRLRAGQYGRLQIPDRSSTGLFIPATAIIHRGQLDFAYVVNDSSLATLRMIRTGRRFGNQVEVLSGLLSAERVVIKGHESLADGDQVRETP